MRQSAGRRRWTVAVTVPTGSLTVTRAMPDAGFGRDPGAGCDRGERDHLHGIVAESHALEGDAVHRAVVFADPAVGTAVVVDQDLAGLPAELLTKRRVADLDESATRCVATLAIDHDVERLLRANVVARPAENARRLVDVVDGVALETAQCGGDRLLIVPGQLNRGHIHALLGRKDGRLLAQVVVGFAMVVGGFDDGQRLRVARHRSPKEFIDRARCAMAPGDGIDDEGWTLHAVATGKELGDFRMPAGIGFEEFPRRQGYALGVGVFHELT